jgi:hypothetical protein
LAVDLMEVPIDFAEADFALEKPEGAVEDRQRRG